MFSTVRVGARAIRPAHPTSLSLDTRATRFNAPTPPQADAASDELLEEKRLVLTADLSGRVLRVSQPGSVLFGFGGLALLGRSLADFVDIFQEVSAGGATQERAENRGGWGVG